MAVNGVIADRAGGRRKTIGEGTSAVPPTSVGDGIPESSAPAGAASAIDGVGVTATTTGRPVTPFESNPTDGRRPTGSR